MVTQALTVEELLEEKDPLQANLETQIRWALANTREEHEPQQGLPNEKRRLVAQRRSELIHAYALIWSKPINGHYIDPDLEERHAALKKDLERSAVHNATNETIYGANGKYSIFNFDDFSQTNLRNAYSIGRTYLNHLFALYAEEEITGEPSTTVQSRCNVLFQSDIPLVIKEYETRLQRLKIFINEVIEHKVRQYALTLE